MSTYVYVAASPVHFIDPEGLLPSSPLPEQPANSITGPSFCGAKGGAVFPANYGLFSFNEPCRLHDICYATCGSNRFLCDPDFLRHALSQCKNAIGLRNPFGKCEILAYAYYAAIREFGQGPFDKAQKENGCCSRK